MRHVLLSSFLLLAPCILLAGCDSVHPSGEEPAVLLGQATPSALTPWYGTVTVQNLEARVVEFTFDKQASAAGVWEGTVGGAAEGDLQTVLLDAREAGPILLVVFDWIITGTPGGAKDFTARLTGTLNTRTGRVVMNGTVTEGWLEGARVHEQGQLVDAETSRFQGIIRIMPGSAG
jgi:hypothetical protein